MNSRNEIVMDVAWKSLIKWGGFSLFIAGVIVIIFIVGVGVFNVTLPLEAEVVLEKPLIPVVLFLITVVGEFLLFPGFLALYFTLRNDNKVRMFMATSIASLSMVMFLVSRSLIFTISKISGSYTTTAIESVKDSYLTTADVFLKAQDVYSTMALIFLSVASILVGSVMLKGNIFKKPIAYIVILSGIFSIFTPFAVNLGIPLVISLIGLVLMLIWQFWVGLKLFKLGKSI